MSVRVKSEEMEGTVPKMRKKIVAKNVEPVNSDLEAAMPMVSVIIASYNRGKMLAQAVNSVLEQSYPLSRIEIVIVDNNSDKKRTTNVLDKYEQMETSATIKVIRLGKTVSSPAILYNIGLDNASGEVVTFLDDDNLLDPLRIRASMVALLSDPTGRTGVIYTGMELFENDNMDFTKDDKPLIPKPSELPSIVSEPEFPLPLEYIHPNDLFVKRCTMDFIGFFDEVLESSIAMEYCIRARRAGTSVKYLPMPLVRYRSHAGQRSQQADYSDRDANRFRLYIAGKERFMRKNLNVYLVGGESDPYMARVIKHIPWISMTDLSNLPSLAQYKKVHEKLPNFVICTDMLSASDSVLHGLYRMPVITLGIALIEQHPKIWGTPRSADVLGWFPYVKWYMTDHADAEGKRDRVIRLDGEPPKTEEEALEFWTEILNKVRANRQFV